MKTLKNAHTKKGNALRAEKYSKKEAGKGGLKHLHTTNKAFRDGMDRIFGKEGK